MLPSGWLATVTDDVRVDEVAALGGTALVHEHLSCDLSVGFGPEYVLDDLDLVTGELRAAREAGIALVIDVGNDGHKRDPEFLRAVATASGMRVVASTGHYRDGFYSDRVKQADVAELTADIVRDITEGIGDSGVRAGAIAEIGMSGEEATELERKAFAAAGAAQVETGVPLLTHTAQGVGWQEQIRMLSAAGADLDRVVIGHMDCLDDHDAHVGVIESGAWLGFDRANSLRYQTDEVRAARLADLIERGYGERVVLSTDTAMVTRLRAHGGAGYAAVLTELLPRLRALGVSEESIRQVSVGNAWRYLRGGQP